MILELSTTLSPQIKDTVYALLLNVKEFVAFKLNASLKPFDSSALSTPDEETFCGGKGNFESFE